MSDIPVEILEEILSRLPVVQLLRFRCVSKSWKGLIENQQFIKQHLNRSRNTNSNLNIILKGGCHPILYSGDFDLLNEPDMAVFKELSHPLESTNGETNILGSCDGLLVLRNYKIDVTILWNPSVRRFHEIPFSGIELPGDNKAIFHGFRYDVVSDDYKLIRIVQFVGNDDEYYSEVNVYSLKSDSWRRIPDFPDFLYYIRTDGLLANGALHWIVNAKVKLEPNKVVAFDLGTEELRLVPIPKFAVEDNYCMDMVVLGGCLSLYCYRASKDHVDIWIMKEYGVQKSWSILFTFDFCDFDCMTPIAFSKCGRKLLLLLGLDFEVLMWYDLDRKSIDVPMVQMPSDDYFATFTCLQSLVLLNNGACDFDLVAKKKQERNDQLAKTGERVLHAGL